MRSDQRIRFLRIAAGHDCGFKRTNTIAGTVNDVFCKLLIFCGYAMGREHGICTLAHHMGIYCFDAQENIQKGRGFTNNSICSGIALEAVSFFKPSNQRTNATGAANCKIIVFT